MVAVVARTGQKIRLEGAQLVDFIGAPGGIRTPNPQIRSLMLCPVELRARACVYLSSCEIGRLLKIDYLQTFFKKESVQRLWNLPIRDEHGRF